MEIFTQSPFPLQEKMKSLDEISIFLDKINKTHNEPQYEWIDYLEKAVEFMSIYYTLILIVLGVVCNTLAIAVLSRPAFQGTSMALYFRFLSVMDLGAILTGLTRFFQISAFGFDVRKGELSCRMNFWIMNIFLFSSSWTLVSVTTERVLSITRPHQVRVICSPKRINHVIFSILLFMAAINSPIFYILGTHKQPIPGTNLTASLHCSVVVERQIVHFLFWWYESAMFAFIPCFILIIFNVIIIFGIVKSKRKMLKIKMTSSKAVTPDTAQNSAEKGNNNKNKSSRNTISSLTVTLLCVNLTFIVCNFPICVYQVTPVFQTDEQLSRHSIVMVQFFLMLMYTNNALNFLLYCITGSKFKNELYTMVSEVFARILRTCRG